MPLVPHPVGAPRLREGHVGLWDMDGRWKGRRGGGLWRCRGGG